MHAAAALPVHVVETSRDWLDYFAAVGGFVGGVAALVALAFARRSARDADKSAQVAQTSLETAQESLAIIRAEHEVARELRAQRADPALSLDVRSVRTTVDGGPEVILLDVGISNTGTRAADRVGLNLLVPDSMTPVPSEQNGGPEGWAKIKHTSERLGDHSGARYAAVMDLGPLAAKGTEVLLRHLRIDVPPLGSHVVKGELTNEDLPEGKRVWWWRLDIKPGEGATLTPLPS